MEIQSKILGEGVVELEEQVLPFHLKPTILHAGNHFHSLLLLFPCFSVTEAGLVLVSIEIPTFGAGVHHVFAFSMSPVDMIPQLVSSW